nr:MAG TPA: GUN4-binding protein domain GUN4 [Caudoviricetes sp.]
MTPVFLSGLVQQPLLPQSNGCSEHNLQICGKLFVKMSNRHFGFSAVS